MLARRYGYLAGGSTGSIIAAVIATRDMFEADSTVVALAPDVGDRYFDTIYNDSWVRASYGFEVLSPIESESEVGA
jgi:cysteine synthase A